MRLERCKDRSWKSWPVELQSSIHAFATKKTQNHHHSKIYNQKFLIRFPATCLVFSTTKLIKNRRKTPGFCCRATGVAGTRRLPVGAGRRPVAVAWPWPKPRPSSSHWAPGAMANRLGQQNAGKIGDWELIFIWWPGHLLYYIISFFIVDYGWAYSLAMFSSYAYCSWVFHEFCYQKARTQQRCPTKSRPVFCGSGCSQLASVGPGPWPTAFSKTSLPGSWMGMDTLMKRKKRV